MNIVFSENFIEEKVFILMFFIGKCIKIDFNLFSLNSYISFLKVLVDFELVNYVCK